MKTSTSTPQNNKVKVLVCFILLAIHSSVFAQNKLAGLMSMAQAGWAIPVICVIGLALFLLTAFMKQRNH
jgi:hypothetical protein